MRRAPDKRLVDQVHDALGAVVRPGDRVIDATAGNGHDTLQLARRVAPDGLVLAIDVQQAAIEATRKRVAAAGLEHLVEPVLMDHATIGDRLPGRREFRAAVFNLGYLPGSDHVVVTTPQGTLAALDACSVRLCAGGLLCVTAYRGHPGGTGEADAVRRWMEARGKEGWQVDRTHNPSSDRPSPVAWIARLPGIK